MKWILVWALACSSVTALGADKALQLEPDQLGFVYQELLEPFDQVECKHEKSTVGLFEWDVYCKLGTKVHTFAVHLVLSRYDRTRYGQTAFELLYWITDRSEPSTREFDSSTIWFHLREADVQVNLIQASVGIENDLATLRLTIGF